MKQLVSKMKGFLVEEEGATMVEYAIMVALIAIVSIAIIKLLGVTVSSVFDKVNTSMGAVVVVAKFD